MIHHSIGASRRVVRVIAAVGGPLLAIIAGSPSNPASAGGAAAAGPQPPLRGSYCEGSDQDSAPPARAAGCVRISGYIAADARFGSDDRIGGRPDLFAPLDEPAIAGGRGYGFKIVGAPRGGEPFLPPANPGDGAR